MYKTKKIIITAVLIILSLLFIFPYYSMIMMGTHYTEELYRGIPLIPGNYTLENLKTVFNAGFERFYANSLTVSISATILSIAVSTFCGYAFSKFQFKFREGLYSFILITLMVPTQLGLVAFVVIMKNIGWINTLLPLIIPPAATGFGVYWMRKYIDSALPNEVLESARIDGANELRILVSIAIPYIAPGIATLAMLNFISSWNSYLVPLVVINKPQNYTVPLGITTLTSTYRNDEAARIMALSLGTLPLVIVFLLGARTFISGLTMGAIKG